MQSDYKVLLDYNEVVILCFVLRDINQSEYGMYFHEERTIFFLLEYYDIHFILLMLIIYNEPRVKINAKTILNC